MEIRFVRRRSEVLDYCSFWAGRLNYTFEITYDTEERFERYSKELLLNLKNQFPDMDFRRSIR